MDRTHDSLSAFINMDVLDPDLLVPSATESFEAVDLREEQPLKLLGLPKVPVGFLRRRALSGFAELVHGLQMAPYHLRNQHPFQGRRRCQLFQNRQGTGPMRAWT